MQIISMSSQAIVNFCSYIKKITHKLVSITNKLTKFKQRPENELSDYVTKYHGHVYSV